MTEFPGKRTTGARDSCYIIGGWTITEGLMNAGQVPVSETVFSLANGNLGVRYSLEEGTPAYKPGTFLNGFYEDIPITYGENAFGFPKFKQKIQALPDATVIKPYINGLPFSMDKGKLLSYSRTLDMKRGEATREILWESPEGITLKFFFRRFVSFARPSLFCLSFTVTVIKGACKLTVKSRIQPPKISGSGEWDPRTVTVLPGGSLGIPEAETTDPFGAYMTFSTQQSRLQGITIATHSCAGFLPREKPAGIDVAPSGLYPEQAEIEGSDRFPSIDQWFTAALEEGSSAGLEKLTHYAVSAEASRSETLARGRSILAKAQVSGFECLGEEQASYMEKFWDRSDIIIEGNAEAQGRVRFGIFSMLQATGSDGRTSVGAKGLSGDGYDGHYFWEAEIYILPFFLYTEPEKARALLQYRHSILPRAKEWASYLGHEGALFPWRTINGSECSAYYPAGTAQYHINADIAYGLQKYFANTGDVGFLLEQGVEILVYTARFWMGLAHFVPGKGYCIHTVTGPDEYTALVDNNAFTNLMAKNNLLFAETAATMLSRRNPREFALLAEKFGIEDGELRAWKSTALSMYVPYDRELGLYKQDDSFMEKPEWPYGENGNPAGDKITAGAFDSGKTTVGKIDTESRIKMLLLHYHPLVIYRHKVLKQPDLALAAYLLRDWFSEAEQQRIFDYYDPLTTGDSSLSAPIQCITAARAHKPALSWLYFKETCRTDLEDTHGNTKDGLHIAAAAGTWLSVIYGFLGLRDREEAPRFFPVYPAESGWSSFKTRLLLRNNLVEVYASASEMTYTLLQGTNAEILHEYTRVSLKNPGDVSRHNLIPVLGAVIFDLDGVITDTAEFHYLAWKKIADELDLPFDRDVNQRLRGVGRLESLDIILRNAGAEIPTSMRVELTERKNQLYREYLERLSPGDFLPGIPALLEELKIAGIKTAVASVSKNAGFVLSKLKAESLFDAVIDGTMVKVGKPDPEVFLEAAEALKTPGRNCVGVEDAQAGIDAINAAGMASVGIGGHLTGAGLSLEDTALLTAAVLYGLFD